MRDSLLRGKDGGGWRERMNRLRNGMEEVEGGGRGGLQEWKGIKME